MAKNNIPNRLDKIHILIMDSCEQVTTLFKNMLAEFGFNNVFVANNGFHGVRIMREVKINLIITDWELKVSRSTVEEESNIISHKDILPLSGVDFIKRVRHSPFSPNPFIPIIMFADTIEKMQLVAARDAGVNEVCIKPLKADELCARIIAIIEHPRIFVTADTYKGPCRRQKQVPLSTNQQERRFREIRIMKGSKAVRKN